MPSLTYTNWSENTASPLTFKTNHFQEISQSGNRFMFARKFSEITDNKILDLIDNRLLNIPVPQKAAVPEEQTAGKVVPAQKEVQVV